MDTNYEMIEIVFVGIAMLKWLLKLEYNYENNNITNDEIMPSGIGSMCGLDCSGTCCCDLGSQ